MKRITVKQLTLCLIFVISSLFAKAQNINCYLPENLSVEPGSTLAVDIRVDGFSNVGGFGLSLNWDPDVLRFKEMKNLGVAPSEFGGPNDSRAVSHGEFGYVWLSPSATTGVTLEDSTLLFSLIFDAIGTADDTTSLRFADDPVASEFYNPTPDIIPTIFANALVTIEGTSNTYFNSAPEKISLYPPVPNPFHERTQITINLLQSTQTTIQIIDPLGKILYENRQYLSAGKQTIPISKEIFHQSGTYYCLLNTDEFRVMQKLVFIDR